MKYINANQILPQKLLEELQRYVQGQYIYIPIKEKSNKNSTTSYKIELKKRDAHIYTKYLEGVNTRQLSQRYNLSESSIRRIIIKQREGRDNMMEEMRKILDCWGLSAMNLKQIYDTTWQVGDNYVLKKYDDLDMLKRNLKILRILEKQNVAVGCVVAEDTGKMYVKKGDSYYVLSEKLAGNNLVDLHEFPNIGVVMGEIIAELHLAFKKCEQEECFWNNSLLAEMNGWIRESFERDNWKHVNKKVFDEVVTALAKYYNQLPVQLIHRDVHFGNFLFDRGKFSGYIDFDLSQRNIRIFDLCYFLLGLLSEEEKRDVTIEQWFCFVKDVFAGYEGKIKLIAEEKAVVPYVMECIELLFVAYFIKENDVVCAENARGIFEFVQRNEAKILECV